MRGHHSRESAGVRHPPRCSAFALAAEIDQLHFEPAGSGYGPEHFRGQLCGQIPSRLPARGGVDREDQSRLHRIQFLEKLFEMLRIFRGGGSGNITHGRNPCCGLVYRGLRPDRARCPTARMLCPGRREAANGATFRYRHRIASRSMRRRQNLRAAVSASVLTLPLDRKISPNLPSGNLEMVAVNDMPSQVNSEGLAGAPVVEASAGHDSLRKQAGILGKSKLMLSPLADSAAAGGAAGSSAGAS